MEVFTTVEREEPKPATKPNDRSSILFLLFLLFLLFFHFFFSSIKTKAFFGEIDIKKKKIKKAPKLRA